MRKISNSEARRNLSALAIEWQQIGNIVATNGTLMHGKMVARYWQDSGNELAMEWQKSGKYLKKMEFKRKNITNLFKTLDPSKGKFGILYSERSD
jgi:hypothetical protein